MATLIRKLANPKDRRELLSLASGGLIALALSAQALQLAPVFGDGLMLAAALVAGWDIAWRAITSLRRGAVTIELLVTIASLGAIVIGEYWEAAAVTFLFIFGAYLEARTLSRTRQVLGELLDLAPLTAVVLREGQQVEVSPEEVVTGELVLVKPGTKVPVDGAVIEGRSAVDESAITGEPIPAEKVEGSPIFAGTINQSGLLKVRATGVGADTTLARIIRRVEEAQDEKAPTQRFIERFARWYTPGIIALSAVSYLITRDVELALTLLVIGCPGALVISTPVSVVAGIGRAAKSGILIKGGEHLESAGKISALALDKTGTLTEGKPGLTDVVALGQGTPGLTDGVALGQGRASPAQDAVLYWAAIAEAGSEHPLARPVVAEASRLGVVPQADTVETLPGKGILAGYQGHTILVGTAELLKGNAIDLSEEATGWLDGLQAQGKTGVAVAVDGHLTGLLGFADSLRPAAPEMIARLKKVGVRKIVMLTGDNPHTAQAIAQRAGIDEVQAGLLPEGKLEAIRRLKAEGYGVAMIGDGVNDAPALAAADTGIAMGAAGTDVAIETAGIALMTDDLLKVPEAIGLSRAVLANIRQNVAIALITVASLLTGVLLGSVHMAGGMLVHQASVLIVILNGMRLLRTSRQPRQKPSIIQQGILS